MSKRTSRMNREEFFTALRRYQLAQEIGIATGDWTAFVWESIRLHGAKGRVPKSWWLLITQTPQKEA